MGYGLCETSGTYPAAKCFLNWNLAFVLILKSGVFGAQGENCPIQDTEDVLQEVFINQYNRGHHKNHNNKNQTEGVFGCSLAFFAHLNWQGLAQARLGTCTIQKLLYSLKVYMYR